MTFVFVYSQTICKSYEFNFYFLKKYVFNVQF